MKTFFLLLAFVLAGCDTSAAINAKSYFDGVQLIFVKAVCAGKFSDADRAIDNGASIDGAGTRGMTPLVFALLDNHRDGVSYLLGKKANVNAVLSDGSSAVSIAASIDDSTYLEMLLNSGGDPNLFNPLREYSPLFASLEHAKIENIKILLRHGTIVDATDRNGNTVLKSAAVMNQYDVAFELLKAGADPTIKNKFNRSALDAIREYRGDTAGYMHQWRIKVVEILASRGCKL